MTTISLRVDREMHEMMRMHDEINWSAVLRKSIAQRLEAGESIDSESAKKASHEIDKIRKSGIFSKGRQATEIIREWRQKRK